MAEFVLHSLFSDVPDLDSRKAAEIAKNREKWKSPSAFKALLTSSWGNSVKKVLELLFTTADAPLLERHEVHRSGLDVEVLL